MHELFAKNEYVNVPEGVVKPSPVTVEVSYALDPKNSVFDQATFVVASKTVVEIVGIS